MKIERMMIACAILTICMGTLLVSDCISIYKSSRVVFSNSAILTASTVTSLTNQVFNVSAIYENENKTQAIIVLDGELANVSYLANSYQVFVDGKSSSLYSGGIYAFGELNKLCVFITNSEGFKVEKTQVIVRSNSSTGKQSSTANEIYTGQDKSYSEHDQMGFYINLGASEAQEVSFLKDEGIDIERMAESAFSHDDDKILRDELTKLQAEAVSARSMLANVRQSLDGVNIQVPILPDWASDTSIANRDSVGTEYVKTSYIFEGLADFDWENCTRLDSYVELANVDIDTLNVDAGLVAEASINDSTIWYYKDNSVVLNPTSSESALIAQYKTTLSAFKSAEYAYQKGVTRLIKNQLNYINGVQNYTYNIGADIITSIKLN